MLNGRKREGEKVRRRRGSGRRNGNRSREEIEEGEELEENRVPTGGTSTSKTQRKTQAKWEVFLLRVPPSWPLSPLGALFPAADPSLQRFPSPLPAGAGVGGSLVSVSWIPIPGLWGLVGGRRSVLSRAE